MPKDEDALIIRIPRRLLDQLMAQEPLRATERSASPDGRHDPDRRGWSDAQRRLLFRLVYKLGHRGPDARRYIDDALGLGAGEEPSLEQASRLIDQLKRDSDGGSRGAA